MIPILSRYRIRKAQSDHAASMAAVLDATSRRDTRAQHAAIQAARITNRRLLEAEMAMKPKPIRWPWRIE